MPRFAGNLSMIFGEHAFLDRFAAARAAGFTAVEFLSPYAWPAAEVADAARDAGVEVALFNLPAGDWDAGERELAALPGRESEFAAGVERGLDYALTIGCPRLHAMAGTGAAASEATYIANLRLAATRVVPTRTTVLIQAINRIDIPGYFVASFARARQLHAAIGSASVRLPADLYHRQVDGEDVAAQLASAVRDIGHVQVAFCPGRHEPDSGAADCHALFAHLDRVGYAGPIGCEYRPAAGTAAGLGWFARYRHAD